MQEVYFSSNILGTYRIVLKNLSVQSMHTIKSADHWLHGLCHRIELHIHFRWRWWRPRRRRLFGGKDSHRAYLQRVYTIYNSVCAIAFGLNRWKDSLWMIFDRKTSNEFVVQNFDYFPKKNSNHFYFLEILSSFPFSIAHFWRIRYFLAHSTFFNRMNDAKMETHVPETHFYSIKVPILLKKLPISLNCSHSLHFFLRVTPSNQS